MYYFDVNGNMMRNWWRNRPSGEKRYVGDNGALYENEWFSISGLDGNGASYTRWYYAGNDGKIYQDGWYTINEKKYRFKSGGELVTVWNTHIFISIRKVARRSIAPQEHIGSLRSMIKCIVFILRGSCRWAGYW